jgi:flap endonuclease-1
LESSKQLLKLMGIPCVQAPSEGEAQAAYLAKEGVVYAAASQDYDSGLFGAPRVVRNLGVTGKRKLPGRKAYVEVRPELVDVERTFRELKITREQLIDIAMLTGTDYCEGVKGLGPKKALALISAGARVEDIYRDKGVEVPKHLEEIREFFLNPPVAEVKDLEFGVPDREGVITLLVDEYAFSEERVARALDLALSKVRTRKSGLSRFIGGQA